jgi:hypothetical protein
LSRLFGVPHRDRTGDLMQSATRAIIYFVDRPGDRFHWKGENASTAVGRRSCVARSTERSRRD